MLDRLLQQEAELPTTQNGALAQQRHRYSGIKQSFLRNAYRDGCAFQAKGQHEDAAKSFSAAVSAAPDFADAVQNLGFSLFTLGKFEEAARACSKLVDLRPTDAGAHFNLGMALLKDDKAEQAVVALKAAARLDDSQVKHHRALGQALRKIDRKPEAIAALMKAVSRDPKDTSLLVAIGALLIEIGDFNGAVGASLLAIQQQPGNVYAQGNLACAFQGLGNSHAALGPARAAVRLAPFNGPAAATLGAVLYTLGHHAEALDRSRHATMLSPKLYQAKMNEALSLEALGRLDEAEVAARVALQSGPDDADAQYNLAALLLASGRMNEESWELYESRLQLQRVSKYLAEATHWRGEDVAGKTVLLHSEQGFGDTIQFVRYAPMVQALGAKVILMVQPELLRLLQGLPGVDAVVPASAELPTHDILCPLLSLPKVFKTALETIPSGAPYLSAEPALVRHWQTPDGPGLKVGLVWAGSTVFVHNRARSIQPEALGPLASVPGVTFHSLQKPAAPGVTVSMVDRMEDAADFADTAAMIAGLDLVISVDSAVAHLAAAMGKEVWLLSRFVGCWRWLRNREDSPWYPTMRIFGQSAPGDWDGVIARVCDELTTRATSPPHSGGRVSGGRESDLSVSVCEHI